MCEEEEKTQGTRKEEAGFPHPAAREVCVWGGKSPSCGSLAGKECLPWLGIHIPPSLSGNPRVTPNLDGGVLCLLPMALKGAETDLRGWKSSSWSCLLPLSNAFITASVSQVFLKELPQHWGPGSSQQACEQDVSILLVSKTCPFYRRGNWGPGSSQS